MSSHPIDPDAHDTSRPRRSTGHECPPSRDSRHSLPRDRYEGVRGALKTADAGLHRQITGRDIWDGDIELV